jgi:hypothetical protein
MTRPDSTKVKPPAGWVAPLLRYLALVRVEDFQHGFLQAPEFVKPFLVSYAKEDCDQLQDSCDPLAALLGGTSPEAQTIRLLWADVRTR